MRSYSFLIVIGLSLFLGYACVPSASDGYQIFYIGGVRGIYNSAWLGGISTMLSTLLLWLFGFFMLRSQISEDRRLRLGQIISATPVSKLRYISAKAISNFAVLVVIDIIFMAAFMAMQLIRGEDYHLRLWDYLAPFMFISLLSLLVLASLTVLFDVLPGFGGAIGNFVFFALWVFFSTISVAVPNSMWDLFGLDSVLSGMVREARVQFPHLINSAEGGSFGYYRTNGDVAAFEWHGVRWNSALLAGRLIWAGAAAGIIAISALLFDRFRGRGAARPAVNSTGIFGAKEVSSGKAQRDISYELTAVERNSSGARLFSCVLAEIRVMLKDMSIWWKLITAAAVAGSFLLPLQISRSWLPVLMLPPIAIWSQMGTRDKYCYTAEIMASSRSPILKQLGVWLAGTSVTLLISAGVLFHLVKESLWLSAGSWAAGVLFIASLGIASGSLSGNRKLFEVIYLLWWYMGPFNQIPCLDFLGIRESHPKLYLGLAACLLAAAAVKNIKPYIYKTKRGGLSYEKNL